MKYLRTTDKRNRPERYFRGVVQDVRVTGDYRHGYVVHAERWTEVSQQRMFRVIHTRTLAEATRKIETNEARQIALYGTEVYPQKYETSMNRTIDGLLNATA